MRLVIVGISVLVFSVGSATARTVEIGRTASAGHVRAWSPQFFNGVEPYSPAQAVAAARSFDTIVALPVVFRSYVSQMKQANPNLTLLLYMKGVFTYDTGLAESAYAHDGLGLRIQGVQFPGTWLLDPTSPVVLAYDLDRAAKLLATSGYDGVFLDTIGTAPLGLGYVSGLPVNQGTGLPWTAVDWLRATAALAGRIAAGTGRPTIGNGLRDGSAYFDPAAPTSTLLQTGMAGAMAEGWLRGANDPIGAYPSEAEWKNDVNALADAGSRGASFFAVTKVWTDGSPAEEDAWYEFAAASFLLGTDGKAYLSFTYSPGDSLEDYPLGHVDLGAPKGPYQKAGSVYQRSFSGGRVLVNPRNWTFTVNLGATYHTLDGTPTATVVLPPHSAEILTL